VGPQHCHTSGRNLDISFRAWVAAQRHMGFEMDPRELTEMETDTLRRITSWWKQNRSWMTSGDILRLDASDPALIAELQMAQDASQFVVFAGLMQSSEQTLPRPLRLTGLDATARYNVTLVSKSPVLSWQSKGSPLLPTGTAELSGQYLMQYGITLPWTYPQSMWVFEGRKL